MIDILLPTYNGEVFLRQLLDSILAQSYKDWRMIVRDDGSEDYTVDIIRDYIRRFGDKFILIEDDLGNLGTSGSNDVLIRHSSSQYFMFCDQDDIWSHEKISACLEEIQSIESAHPGIPVLVCSDACCIDQQNNLICKSFFKSQKFIDTTDSLYKMLALNIVQGSTTLMNSKVRNVVTKIPSDCLHDAWVACIVKYYGIVSYLHKPLLQYRQHNNNVVGALDIGPWYLLKKIIHIVSLYKSYYSNFQKLPFRPSMLIWIYYKAIINIKRVFLTKHSN